MRRPWMRMSGADLAELAAWVDLESDDGGVDRKVDELKQIMSSWTIDNLQARFKLAGYARGVLDQAGIQPVVWDFAGGNHIYGVEAVRLLAMKSLRALTEGERS